MDNSPVPQRLHGPHDQFRPLSPLAARLCQLHRVLLGPCDKHDGGPFLRPTRWKCKYGCCCDCSCRVVRNTRHPLDRWHSRVGECWPELDASGRRGRDEEALKSQSFWPIRGGIASRQQVHPRHTRLHHEEVSFGAVGCAYNTSIVDEKL